MRAGLVAGGVATYHTFCRGLNTNKQDDNGGGTHVAETHLRFDGEAFMAQKQPGYLPLLFVVLPLVHGCLTNNAASMRKMTSSHFQVLLPASLRSRDVACHSRNTGVSMKMNAVPPDLVGTLC